MIRTGKVIQAEGETLKVCFSRMGACADCGMCGTGRDSVVTLRGAAQEGDTVEVEMPDARVLKASLVTYALPLVTLILGMWAGTALYPSSDLHTALGAAAGLGLGIIALRAIDRRLGGNRGWQPRIVSVTRADEAS
ncbi:MAG TPA: SoxR reducing system RseC family protein [Candidatus Limnocylindria bacterium]|nr:SoxR reducing system RseC family protein [Candidatus Limnocylindria bacterium]